MPFNAISTTLVCKLWQVTDLNLEEGGAFTVSSAEEILSGGPGSLAGVQQLQIRPQSCVCFSPDIAKKSEGPGSSVSTKASAAFGAGL